MLRPERQKNGVVAGGCLELEVEGDAEPLAQREPERAVQPCSERRVPDQLHPAGLVEEPLEHDRVHGGQHTELSERGAEVRHDGLGGRGADAALGLQPADCRGLVDYLVACPVGCQLVSDRGPERADLLRQLDRPARCLAEPERHRGRRAMGVLHPDDTGLYPPDPPRGRAEQEDISHHALDRPVLVDRADERVVWLGQDPVVAELRDRTARGQRRHAGTSPALQLPADLVPVQVGGAPAAAGRDSLGKQADDLIEFRCRHRRERRRASEQGKQVVLRPLGGRALGDHLLGQDVERAGRNDERVQPARAGAAQQRGAFDQLVPGRGIQPPGRNAGPGVIGPADPLQECREAARRSDLADQFDWPDIDTEFERGGRHQRAKVTAAQPGLNPLPSLLRQAAVMRGDLAVAEPLAELVRDPLGHPPGVDEDDRGLVLMHVAGDQVEDLGHLLGGGYGPEFVAWQLHAQVELAAVARVHDGAARRAIRLAPLSARPDQQPGHGLDRPLRRGQSDPLHRLIRHVHQPFQGQREMGSALVPGDGVDLVHNDCAGGAEHCARPLGRQQQVERLRRGDQEVGRPLQHRGPLSRRGVPGPDRDPDRRRGQAKLGGHRGNLGQRTLQVLPDVHRERFQR